MNETIENAFAAELVETVSNESNAESRLIKYLKNLARRQDRAALANLRRGLGKPPKTAMEMYPYLGQFLSRDGKRADRYENAVFIVAALFAYYPDAPGSVGNLGASLQRLNDKSDGIEKRFVALLNASAEDLPYYLRQIIGLLKSNEIAVNWEQLLGDVQYWESRENSKYESVQTRWARGFWGNFNSRDNNQNSQPNSGGTIQ